MSAEAISYEEWVAELERLQGPEDAEGLSSRQVAALWGCSDRVTRERLRRLADAGRLVVSRRTILSIDGRRTFAPVYRLKPAAVSPPVAAKASSGRSKGGSR